jgi:hypothetical protein
MKLAKNSEFVRRWGTSEYAQKGYLDFRNSVSFRFAPNLIRQGLGLREDEGVVQQG